jgi:hypothetical protein
MSKSQSKPEQFGRWLRLKHYQFKVTFAVNVYTPTEKLFFWFLLCLIFSLMSMATIFYVSRSILYITNRTLEFFLSQGAGLGPSLNGVTDLLSRPVTALRSTVGTAT